MTYKLIEHSIEDIADIIGGGTPSSKVEEYYGGNIPWITPKDLSGYNDVYISKGSRNITELGLSKSSAKMLPENAVLFTSRAPIGYVAIAESQVCTNQGFKSLIPKADLLDYKFAYYLMKYYAPQIEASASGTTFKEISGGALKTFKVKIPESTETQRNIADILFKLDSKISNNTAMNSTLEKIAQRIFKSWFVDFDPVKANAEGVPFDGLSPEIQALFPNEFEESGLGMIPKGWEVNKHQDVIDVRDGTHDSPKKSESGNYLITSKHITSGVLNLKDAYLISPQDFEKVNARSKVEVGDILMSMIGTLGVTYMVSDMSTPFAIKNIALFRTSQNTKVKNYFYFHFKNMRTQSMLSNFSSGTTQKYLSLTLLRNLKICMPTSEVLTSFNQIVEPLMNKISINNQQINTLAEIRDKLLPRLISGKITIQKAEELLEEAS